MNILDALSNEWKDIKDTWAWSLNNTKENINRRVQPPVNFIKNQLNETGYAYRNLPSLGGLFVGRKGLDPEIMKAAETVREMESYRRQGRLTADTESPVGFGDTTYLGAGIDPGSTYHPYGNDKEYYEGIPSGYALEEEGGRAFDTPENIEKRRILRGVKDFIVNKYPGSRITSGYFDALASKLDQDTLLRALAMSIAETGAGRDASAFKGDGSLKQNNFYGYHLGGNQYDPDLDTMISDLNRAFGPGGRYETIDKNTLSWYVRGLPYEKLTPEQKASVDAEYGRYAWARQKFGL